jgi:class 3 adenylate cyclase
MDAALRAHLRFADTSRFEPIRVGASPPEGEAAYPRSPLASPCASRRALCKHRRVPELSAKERARLPDSAFAYIDSTGKRKLPIHDAAHVRNALARFNRVVFEDDAARDRARTRLLRAAQKHGVAPIGFIRSELQPHRRLPSGHVTFLITDVESSTELLARLGEAYAPLLMQIRRLVRVEVRQAGGQEVDSRGDETFAVFREGTAALQAALAIQRAVRDTRWPGDGADVRLRIGLHSGRTTMTDTGYVGLAVHAAARVCFAGHGGQILMTSAVHSTLGDGATDRISLTQLGSWRFRGLPKPIELFQVDAAGDAESFPPPRDAVPASER